MRRAATTDKLQVLEILANSFYLNASVNYIVKQDDKIEDRIRSLMDYSFEVCMEFGEVFLSDDNQACALIVYPDKKKTTLKSMLLDLKLILNSVGFRNIQRTVKREKVIAKIQPRTRMSYLWFIGVKSSVQKMGIGSSLLNEIIEYSNRINRPIYLETSTISNIPWYKKFGFEVYDEYDFTYHLFFLKRNIL